MMHLKLKDPSGMFFDSDTGLRIVRGQTVKWDGPIGRLTRSWLNEGGLVVVKPVTALPKAAPSLPEDAGETTSPVVQEAEPEPEPPVVEERPVEKAPVKKPPAKKSKARSKKGK